MQVNPTVDPFTPIPSTDLGQYDEPDVDSVASQAKDYGVEVSRHVAGQR